MTIIAWLDQNASLRYTQHMKHYRLYMLLILLMGMILAACNAGHVGGNEIAFIHNGHLWTIDPDGANAFQIVSQETPVVGYSWSPNHQQLVFRTIDKTVIGRQTATNPITGQIPDVPSTVNTIGIDGGTSIPVMLSDTSLQYSNPYWNTNSTRLVFRQESSKVPFVAGSAVWWVTQSDQPEGIAAKHLPPSYSLPSIAYNSSLSIGNSQDGLFTSTLQGTNIHYLLSSTLPGHPLPAPLERILWQPAHAHPLILYAIKHKNQTQASSGPSVQLVVLSQNEQSSVLTTCTCTQFAWSPDGTTILYTTGTSYTLLDVNKHSSFHITENQESVPYWSHNSKFLLLDGQHQLQLFNIATQQLQTLLTDGEEKPSPASVGVNVNALVQPVPNSIWATDSQHFLFLTRGRLSWQGKHLSPGLYAIALDVQGHLQGQPTSVDSGNDSQVGWTYQDPNTSFLY